MEKHRLLTVFVVILLILSGFSVITYFDNTGEAGTEGIKPDNDNLKESKKLIYNLNPGTLDRIKKKSYRSLGFSDCKNGLKPTTPSVPVKNYRYLLPKNADADDVEIKIESFSQKQLEGDYYFEPVERPTTDGLTLNENEKDSNIYKSSSYYPKNVIDDVEVHKIRKATILSFDYFPLKWNPSDGRVILNKDVSVAVEYEINSEASQDSITYDMLTRQKGSIDNFEETSSTYKTNDETENETYAIVTTNNIVDNSNNLSDFKQYLSDKGLNVTVITEDEYGSSNEGQQRAIDIRNYLSNNYLSKNISYALMVGDPDPDDVDLSSDSYGEVPMMMCYPRHGESNYEESPTDYFYADLTGDWDLDDDGYYGEYNDDEGSGGVDLNAEIHVGRIPVYNDDFASLDDIFSNIIDYQSKSGSWKKRMMLPMAISNYENEDDEGHARSDGLDCPEYTYNNILSPAGFSDEVMYERAGLEPVPTSSFHYSQPISSSNFIDTYNQGYGSVFWWGHGSQDGVYRKYWANDDDSDGIPENGEMDWYTFMTSSDVDQLEKDQPSFFYQSSCNNGYPENDNNLGYRLLKDGGAVSTVSASRVSWYAVGTWSPTTSYADNTALGYYYMKSLILDEKSAGEAISYAKSFTDEAWGGESWMNKFDFNLYGDPSQKYVIDNTKPTADAGEDKTVDEDVTVTFNGSGSSDNTEIKNYTWTIEENEYYGEIIDYTFNQPGSYLVVLNVTDGAGNWDTDTANVTVLDITSPSVDAGDDKTTEQGSIVELNGSDSSDNVGIVNYTWSMNGTYRYGEEISYSFDNTGLYEIVLNVSDDAGNYDTDTVNITVLDSKSPTADAGEDRTVDYDDTVVFNGSGSSDNLGIVNFTWKINNTEKYGMEVYHKFADTGTYEIILNVTDEAGNWDTDVVNITVEDQTKPTADAGEDRTVSKDETITFDGSNSSDNVGIVDYNWTIEGIYKHGETIDHTFTEKGTFEVILNVTDDAGNYDTDVCNITVKGNTQPPTADAGNDQFVAIAEEFTLNGSGSSDNVGIYNYTWVFDGKEYNGLEITHSFSNVGIYTFILNVTDKAGNWDTDSVNITVEDQTKPTAKAGDDRTVDEDTMITLDGSSSYDNVGIVEYEWLIEGSYYYGETVDYEFTDPGTYEVKLTVKDDTGNYDEDVLNITVNDTTSPRAEAGEDIIVGLEETFTLDGSDSSDNVGIVNYTWAIESQEYYGKQIYHSFSDLDAYNITLTIKDKSGNTDTDYLIVTVKDYTSPVADAGEDKSVDEDQQIIFNASGSSDNVEIVDYTWTVDGDVFQGKEIEYNFTNPGTYQVELKVTDDAGNYDTDSLSIKVRDVTKPNAMISGKTELDEDVRVNYSASGSYDNVGVVNYTWIIEGTEIYGKEISYKFKDPGNYSLKLNISDSAGNYAYLSREVSVNDITSPNADTGNDRIVSINEEVIFDASSSTDNMAIESYHWIIDNDEYESKRLEISFDKLGRYTANLTVVDTSGNLDKSSVNITVVDSTKPVADAGEDRTESVEKEITFNGSKSIDNGNIENYTWTIEGKKYYGKTVKHTFNELGMYDVKISVIDSAGNFDSDEIMVTIVDKIDPTASINLEGDLIVGEDITLDASESSDNVGIASYEWNFGDGTSARGAEVTNIYQSSGEYDVSLVVTDENGNTDEYKQTISIEQKGDEDSGSELPGFTLIILLLVLSLLVVYRYNKKR